MDQAARYSEIFNKHCEKARRLSGPFADIIVNVNGVKRLLLPNATKPSPGESLPLPNDAKLPAKEPVEDTKVEGEEDPNATKPSPGELLPLPNDAKSPAEERVEDTEAEGEEDDKVAAVDNSDYEWDPYVPDTEVSEFDTNPKLL